MDVGVDVQNEITVDLGFLGEAIEALKQSMASVGERTNSILEGFAGAGEKEQKLKMAEILVLLNGQQLEAEQEAARTVEVKKLKNVVLLGLVGAGLFFYYRKAKK